MIKEILSLCRSAGIADPEIKRLKGDLSERILYRIRHRGGSLIAVSGPDLRENEAFLNFRQTFEENGFNVPGFIAASEDSGVYFIEDLGEETVKSACDKLVSAGDTESVKKIYRKIMSVLPAIQTVLYDKIDYTKCYQSTVFERENMEKDTERFEEYFLKRFYLNYSPEIFRRFKKETVSSADSQAKNYFLYRDFQTRNIMIRDGELYFIDFQSGRKGSFYYDPASFIYSSGTFSYEGMEEDLLHMYYNSSRHINDRMDHFRSNLYVFACLRIMQALGNYACYYYEKGNRAIESKKDFGLKSLWNLSRNLNIETGIY